MEDKCKVFAHFIDPPQKMLMIGIIIRGCSMTGSVKVLPNNRCAVREFCEPLEARLCMLIACPEETPVLRRLNNGQIPTTCDGLSTLTKSANGETTALGKGCGLEA
jgi:hypothetical protein